MPPARASSATSASAPSPRQTSGRPPSTGSCTCAATTTSATTARCSRFRTESCRPSRSNRVSFVYDAAGDDAAADAGAAGEGLQERLAGQLLQVGAGRVRLQGLDLHLADPERLPDQLVEPHFRRDAVSG